MTKNILKPTLRKLVSQSNKVCWSIKKVFGIRIYFNMGKVQVKVRRDKTARLTEKQHQQW